MKKYDSDLINGIIEVLDKHRRGHLGDKGYTLSPHESDELLKYIDYLEKEVKKQKEKNNG